MTLTTFFILTLINLVLYLTYKYFTKSLVEYQTDSFVVNIKHLKNVPVWLKSYNEITITQSKEITHKKEFNDVKITYKLTLESYRGCSGDGSGLGDDDDHED